MAKRSSLRRQLIAWNTLTLAVVLGALGLATHFVAYGFAFHSVQAELERSVTPPPRHGPPPDRREDERHEPNPDDPAGLGPNPGGDPGRDPGGPHGPNDSFGFGRPPGPDNPAEDGHPLIFSLAGKPLQRGVSRHPWDLAALAKAVVGSPTMTQVSVDGEPYLVATRRLASNPGESNAVVQAAYSLKPIDLAIEALDRGILALVPIGIAAAWLAARVLTGRMLGRVGKFAYAAESMGEDDLSKRLPVEGTDEFAELAGTFNGLLARLETAFKRQSDALEQQRRFTADASHELKTPLTVIKGTTSMALARSNLDESSAFAFQEIDRSADGMVKLVHDLLYLARADAGSLGSDRREVLAMEVLERARSSVVHIEGAKVSLASVDPETTLFGNELELARLFTNLLSNARRHTECEGRVLVSANTTSDLTKIVVEDNGCGIAQEHLSRLGQRFYRADASRSREDGGTGLGLAIAHEIVSAHGGTLTFQSAVGKGTRVEVILPASS